MDDNILVLEGISKSFGETHVLDNINMNIKKGEFVTILGGSGSGKTTLLRIIAGLDVPDSGKVILNGKDVTFTEPNKRNVNTVFQNYALFPHMNIHDNVGYSLKLKKMSKEQITKIVKETLELVQLEGYENRMPSELSGGQKQRVAIARTVVNNPSVLLLDEPLGALDLQLRRQMQQELKSLQKRLGITFIYITHDQEEALTMSDRVAVLNNRGVEQIDTAKGIYNNPKTSYVAKFIGESNTLPGEILEISDDGIITIKSEFGEMKAKNNTDKKLSIGQKVTVAVRGENVDIRKDEFPGYFVSGKVSFISFSGAMLRMTIEYPGGTITSSKHGFEAEVELGDKVYLSWDPALAALVDLEEV